MSNTQDACRRFIDLNTSKLHDLIDKAQRHHDEGFRRTRTQRHAYRMKTRYMAASLFLAGIGWSAIRHILPQFDASDQLAIEHC